MCREDELPEDVIKEVKRIADKSSPHSPYFDNVHDDQNPGPWILTYQDRSEVEQVKDWAKEMRKRGHSIGEPKPNFDESGNKDDPPDILVKMDGKEVGIEVTNLMKYVNENRISILSSGKETILEWKHRQGQIVFTWSDSDLDNDERKRFEETVRENPSYYQGKWTQWTLESFQQCLTGC